MSTKTTSDAGASRGLAAWRQLPRSQQGMILAYVAVLLLFVIGGIYRPGFVRLDNIGQLLLLSSFTGLVAAGQTFVILIGGIDLSVPWVLNAMAVLLTTTSLGQDSRAWWVVPLCLIVGALIGLVNGVGIVFFDIPPVVMTLGMNGVMQGLVLGMTGGFTCPTCNSVAPPSVQGIFVGQFLFGLPNGLLVWILISIIVGVVLSLTTLGRRIYALGNNALAAYLAGVDGLEAAPHHAGGRQPGGDVVHRHAQGGRRGGGGQGVVDVEAAAQLQPDAPACPGESGTRRSDFQVVGVAAPVQEGPSPGCLHPLNQALAPLVVGVYHRHRRHRRCEQAGLGLEVGLHVAVVVEVVLGEVGEHGSVEGDGGDPLLDEGVGRDFHGDGAHSRVAQFSQTGLQLRRFGGRPGLG